MIREKETKNNMTYFQWKRAYFRNSFLRNPCHICRCTSWHRPHR